MAKVNVLVNLSKVDWKMLQNQKGELLELRRRLECKPGKQNELDAATLTGIIHLLDEIQDQAAEQIGTENVF
jgi:hypothetical protein